MIVVVIVTVVVRLTCVLMELYIGDDALCVWMSWKMETGVSKSGF